jgi:hypothetical protein
MAEIDPVIQDFVEARWHIALEAANAGMESLRELVPEMSAELAELDIEQLANAMHDFESAARRLRACGPSLLGEEEYAERHTTDVDRRLKGD